MPALHADDHQLASRYEPRALTDRVKPADPYAAWLEQREVERGAASPIAMPRPAGRFRRGRQQKAPWEAISVRLSPDGP